MSATCTHKTFTNQTETEYTITLTGNTGSVTELVGYGDVFTLEYENIEPTKLHANPIQSARLEFNFLVKNSDDKQILDNIFNADEGAYTLSLKQGTQTLFSGSVLNDMLEFTEGDYPFQSKIVAKDFTRLKGFLLDHESIPTEIGSTRASLSTVIEEILSPIRNGRDINYYVTWGHDEVTGDFVDGIFLDTTALQDFNKREDPNDNTDFSNYDILESLCKNFGLIIRQAKNEFQVYQYSAISQLPTISVDNNERYVLPSSLNVFNPGVKTAKYTYNHRTLDGTIKLPDEIIPQGGSTQQSEDFTQAFVSSGEQEIQIDARSTKLDFSSASDAEYRGYDLYARVQIKIEAPGVTYYFDADATDPTEQWITSEKINLFKATKTPLNKISLASIAIRAGEIPADADGLLTVSFFNAIALTTGTPKTSTNFQAFADTTTYGETGFTIFNEESTGNTNAIGFQMVQDGTFSEEVNHGGVFFGEGPVVESPGSLTYSNDANDLTDGNWVDPNGNTVTFAELLLKEIIGVQSRGTRNLQAELYGAYDAHSALVFDGATFFFIGGSLNGNNIFSANFIEIEYLTATITAFDQIEEDSAGGLGGGLGTDDLITFREAVKANQFFNTIFLSNFIGELTSPISAGSTITSFTANLSAQIRAGEDFVLVDKANERPFFVSVVADPSTGAQEYNTGENRVVHVEEQFISNELPAGSPVILAGGLLESYFTIDPTKLLISVEEQAKSFNFGEIQDVYSDSLTSKTSLSISNPEVNATNFIQFTDGQNLRIRRKDGESQVVKVDGNQTFTSSPYTVQLQSFNPAFSVIGLSVASANLRGRAVLEPTNIGSTVASIEIKANDNEASITSLTSFTNDINDSVALVEQKANANEASITQSVQFDDSTGEVRLVAGPGGSEFSVVADQINIDGTTTFASGFDPSTKSVTIRSTTEPTQRTDGSSLEQGDVWIDTSDGDRPHSYNGTSFVQSLTIIDGGNISTGFISADRIQAGSIDASKIDVADLFAEQITIDQTTGSIQSTGFSTGSAGFKIEGDGGAEFNDITVRNGTVLNSVDRGSFTSGNTGVQIVNNLNDIANPEEGEIAFLTTDGKLYRYNGSAWVKNINIIDDTDGEVTSGKLADLSVLEGKLANLSVSLAKIQDGAVSEVKIQDNSISTPKLQANSVTANEILADTITANEIATDTITSNEIASDTITANEIASNTITANEIASQTITANEIASEAITADKILAGAITSAKIDVTELSAISSNIGTITAGTIDASQVSVTNLDADNITSGTLDADRIGADSITANKLDVTSLNAVSTNTGSLSVTGVLTMGASGEITNSGGDYVLDEDGLRMEAVSSGVQGDPNAIRFVSTTGSAVAEMRAFKELIVQGIDIFDEHTLQLKSLNADTGRDRIRLDCDIVLISNDLEVGNDIDYVGTLTDISDQLLKENVVPLGSTLDKITQLEAKVYDLIGESTTREIGLFAQDVEPLFPEAVKDRTKPNEEGEEITYKTLSYIQLIPALIESIKELKQEIDQLKNG